MKKDFKLLDFIKNPPVWFIICAWCVAAVIIGVTIALVSLTNIRWYMYLIFVLAAVFLAYSIFLIVRMAPKVKAAVMAGAQRRPFFNNLFTSYGFRTVTFFVLSFTINIAFAIFNGVMGIVAHSVWYGIMACYYIFLSGLRGAMLFGGHKIKNCANGDADRTYILKLKMFRLCGISLFLLEIAMSAAVTLMIVSERPTEYSRVMAIVCAAYTFYKLIFAIINLCKVRRLHDPLLQSFRNINLADAAVSLLSLQVTLVAVFSEGKGSEMNALNAITGAAVCVLTIILGATMIVSATGRLKKFKRNT